jgi:hypothetical protein
MQVHAGEGALASVVFHLVCSFGRSWGMWDGGNMGLLFVGM